MQKSPRISALKKLPGVFWGLIILFVVLSIFTDGFLSPKNILNVLDQGSILTIVALGVTLTILMGGIDLSVGGTMCLSGMVAAMLLSKTGSFLLALAVAVIVGAIIGLINSVFIVQLKMEAFIVTFAMMSVTSGLVMGITEGQVIIGFPDFIKTFRNFDLFGISVFVLIAIVLFCILNFFLYRTTWGTYMYAVGGNQQVAHYAGIKTGKIKSSAYLLSGLFAGVGGFLLLTKMGSGMSTTGIGYEWDAIAAVVIGGTPFEGGRGGIKGTLIGVGIIIFLKNGLNHLGLTSSWQMLVIGIIVIVSIMIDVYFHNKKKRLEA